MTPKTIDSLDEQLISDQTYADPYPFYDLARAEAPVYYSQVINGWMLTRYVDVGEVLRDHERFSNAGRMTLFTEKLPDSVRAEIGPLLEHFSRAILHVDPPQHTNTRNALQQVFTKARMQRMQTRVQQLVDELIDRSGKSENMDIISDFGYPLAMSVLGELLGLPLNEYDLYKQWSDDVGVRLFGQGKATVESVATANASLAQLTDRLGRLIDERRQSPRDDVISGLAHVPDFTDKSLISTAITLVLAGHGTTMNLIGNSIYALLRHPDQMQRLKRDPPLITRAIEELLRYDSSIQRLGRKAAIDIELGGQLIRKGDMVYPTMGAANRDPAEFTDPHRLDLKRSPNRHLSFGTSAHHCIGAALARLQGSIAINTILQRCDDLQLATDTLHWEPHLWHRGLKALPVRFKFRGGHG